MRRSVPLAAGLVALVLLVDVALALRSWALLPQGLLDETGHLATAGLGLLAAERLGLRLRLRVVLVVLAGAVLIDVDHVPLYAGVPGVAAAGGRPFTHSLLTVAVLLGASAALRVRRPLLLAVAAGVLLHFLRDVATAPGLALLWPASVVVRAPYPAYVVALLGLAAAASLPAAQLSGSSPPRRR